MLVGINIKYMNRNIVLSFAAKLLYGLHWFSPVILLYFQNVIGLSVKEFFFLQAYFNFCIFVLEIPTGYIADKISRKLSLLLSGITACAGLYVMHIAYGIGHVIVAETLLALHVALNSGAFESLFYDYHDKASDKSLSQKYTRNLSYFNNVYLVGILASTLLGSIMAAYIGLDYIYLLTLITAVCATTCVYFMSDVKSDNRQSEVARNKGIFRSVYDVLHAKRTVLMLALDMALVPAVAFMGIWLYQPFLISFEASVLLFGFVHAGMVVCQLLINYFVNHYKGNLRTYVQNTQILIGILFVVLAVSPYLWLSSLCLMLIVGVGMTRGTYLNAELQSHLDSSFRSTFFSGVSMINQLARMIITFFLGYLVAFSPNFAAFVMAGLMFVVYMLFNRYESELLDLESKKII